jgi:hypothetical protein
MVEAGLGVAIIPSYGLPACRGRKVVISRLVNPVVPLDFSQILCGAYSIDQGFGAVGPINGGIQICFDIGPPPFRYGDDWLRICKWRGVIAVSSQEALFIRHPRWLDTRICHRHLCRGTLKRRVGERQMSQKMCDEPLSDYLRIGKCKLLLARRIEAQPLRSLLRDLLQQLMFNARNQHEYWIW